MYEDKGWSSVQPCIPVSKISEMAGAVWLIKGMPALWADEK